MRVDIVKVRSIRKNTYGDFTLSNPKKATIRVSMSLNKTVAEYGATLLHELLHLYFTMLRLQGAKFGGKRKEHEMIYQTETIVIRTMQQTLGGK